MSTNTYSDNNIGIDLIFVLHKEYSCSDGLHLTSSYTEDDISNIYDG